VIGVFCAVLVSVFISQGMGKASLLIGQSLLILPALVYISKKKYDVKEVFRLHPINRRLVLISIVLGVSITILTDEVDRIIGTFIEFPEELEQVLTDTLKATSMVDWILILFAGVILAGITEEMLFRGMLQKALERRFEINQAVFLSAFIFALIHAAPWWLIQILILGVVLGFMAWRSGSIIPGIILHCINNTFAIIFLNIAPENFSWYNWNDHINPPIIAIAACITFYGFKWFYKFTESPTES